MHVDKKQKTRCNAHAHDCAFPFTDYLTEDEDEDEKDEEDDNKDAYSTLRTINDDGTETVLHAMYSNGHGHASAEWYKGPAGHEGAVGEDVIVNESLECWKTRYQKLKK